MQEEQIRYADLILLNKVDRIDEQKRQEMEAALRRINPRAQIIGTDHGRVEPGLLSGEGKTALTVAEHHHEHSHDHDEELPHAASTLFLPLAEPVARDDFQRFLKGLPKSVFRAKGFVRFADSPGQLHTFQQVRDQAELVLLPLEEKLNIETGLVLIGPHLEEKLIRQLAEASITSPSKILS